MSKIPCEMIRDLFPSYIDQLTSDTTNQQIEEHLADCKECSEILEAMHTPEAEPAAVKDDEKKNIDFLKKINRLHKKIIIGSAAAAVVLIGAVLAIRAFLVGDYLYGDWLDCKVKVNGNQVVIDGVSTDDFHGISRVTFKEENGIVTASTKAVLVSPLHKGDFHAEYTASTDDITQVRINDRILWAENYEITCLTSAVYQTRHDYMGDMSANNRTANALNLGGYLGDYTNELLTSEHPYTWKIILSEEIPAEEQMIKESDMDSLAYIMLAVIGNLEQVTYEYTADGQALTKNVTIDDAEIYSVFGIKYTGSNVRALDELISATGLSVSPTYHDNGSERNHDAITIQLLIDTDDIIKGFYYTMYRDGEVMEQSYEFGTPDLGTGHIGSFGYIKPDESEYFQYLNGKIGDLTGHELEMALTVETTDGKQYEIKDRMKIPTVYGSDTTVRISGSSKKGFSAEVTGTHYFHGAAEN